MTEPYRTTHEDMGLIRVLEETDPEAHSFKTIANYATLNEARAFLEGVQYITEGGADLPRETWDRAVTEIRGPVIRKRTSFMLCPRHQWIASESRERRAEIFVEDGPTDGPCTPGDACKIRPGRDLFVAELCGQRDWFDTTRGEHSFRWSLDREPQGSEGAAVTRPPLVNSDPTMPGWVLPLLIIAGLLALGVYLHNRRS